MIEFVAWCIGIPIILGIIYYLGGVVLTVGFFLSEGFTGSRPKRKSLRR